MFDRRPAAIVQPLGVADVIDAIRFAREHGLSIAVKGGGHNIAGLAVADACLLIDMSRARGVVVDAAERTAVAQTGCLLGDVDRETQVHGLATVMGFVSATGIAGLTLGGGFGYLSRRFGWTSDNVLAMNVVTAAGEVVRASEREHPDLFWALRGGGGNFGVVTSITYRLHDVGPEILGGPVAWAADDAPAVLDMYRAVIADAPPELTVVPILRPAPPAPWIPQQYHGTPIVVLVVCDTGPADAAEERVRAITSFGSPIGSVVQRRTYVSLQSLLDATQPKGRRYYWKSEYLPTVTLGPARLPHRSARDLRVATLGHHRVPHRRRPSAAPERPLGRGQSRRRRGPEHRGLVGSGRGRREEHRVGSVGVAGFAALLDRRRVRQLPDRGRGRGPDPGVVRGQSRSTCAGEGGLGSRQRVPPEQEHRAKELTRRRH